MNRVRPFVNRLLKQKELELTDVYHDQNLKEIKPLTLKLMEHTQTVTINHSKREMIKQVREQEIQRENKLLLHKITNVIAKKGNYSLAKTKSITTKASKSLNQIARKKQFESIQLQNKQLLSRLNSKRATLNTLKLKKDWEDSRSLIKRMENTQFNMVYFKYKETGMKMKKNDKLSLQSLDKINISQFRTISGQKMLIKVMVIEGFLNIVGDLGQKDLKVIKIPKEEAATLIETHCSGKIGRLLDRLSYDRATQTLYLTNEEPEQAVNPEKASTKPTNDRLKSLTHRINKTDLGFTPSTNKSERTDLFRHQITSLATIQPKESLKSHASQVELKQKTEQVDEYQQDYQEEQLEQPNKQDAVITKEELAAIQNEKQDSVVPKQAQPAGEEILIEEEENYNEDFQQADLQQNKIQTL